VAGNVLNQAWNDFHTGMGKVFFKHGKDLKK